MHGRPHFCPYYGFELGQHFVHEHVNIGKRIPWSRRRLCRTDSGSHALVSMLKKKGRSGWMLAFPGLA